MVVTAPSPAPGAETHPRGPESERRYLAVAVSWLAALATLSGTLWPLRFSYLFLIPFAVSVCVVALVRYGGRAGLVAAETLSWAAVVVCVFGAVIVLPLLALPAVTLLAVACRRRSRRLSVRYQQLRHTWRTPDGLRRARWGMLTFLAGLGGWALSFKALPHTNPLWWATSATSVVAGVVSAGRLGLLVFVQQSCRQARQANSATQH